MSIYIYKTGQIPDLHTVRYEVGNINDVSITMDQPVSPMALPQESARENVLVKMEGNTETITISWRIPNGDTSSLKKQNSILTQTQIQNDADESSPVSWDVSHTYDDSSEITAYLLEWVQGKNITDSYFLKLPNQTIRQGFLTRMNFTISADSPVVWSGSLTFITGNVLSIYDADTPSEPRSFSATQSGSSIRLRWQPPSDTTTTIAQYVVYRKDGEDGGYLRAYELTDSGLDGAVSGATEYKEYAVTGLTSGKLYYFKIAAENSAGEGLKTSESGTTFP